MVENSDDIGHFLRVSQSA